MNDEINDIYLKAFNHAYLISKYESELAKKLVSNKNDGIYFQGFEDGRNQFVSERSQSRSSELDLLKRKDDHDLER